MISFHNSNSTKDVVAYFKLSSSGSGFIGDILKQRYGQNISPKVEEYRGKKIEIYPLGKTANFLSVLSGDGYLVISYHKLLIERVIDAIKDGTSLSDDVVFSNHKVKKSANYLTFMVVPHLFLCFPEGKPMYGVNLNYISTGMFFTLAV